MNKMLAEGKIKDPPIVYEHTEHNGVPFVRVYAFEACDAAQLLSMRDDLDQARKELLERQAKRRREVEIL